jgi:hypothetical protein
MILLVLCGKLVLSDTGFLLCSYVRVLSVPWYYVSFSVWHLWFESAVLKVEVWLQSAPLTITGDQISDWGLGFSSVVHRHSIQLCDVFAYCGILIFLLRLLMPLPVRY